MLAAYQFKWESIFDIAAVVLLLGAMFFFFAKKKSVRLLIIYSAALIVYVGVLLFDSFYAVPIAKAAVDLMVTFMVVALIVVYSSDFKTLFFKLAKTSDKTASDDAGLSDEELRVAVDEIIRACQSMSKARTGALIVIAPTNVASHVLNTGTELGALVSASLLESVFNTRAPLHDGAVIIKGNKILAAGCFLPLSQSQSVSKNLGTRHRAGIGITEETDMLTIIVSEETGIISIASGGELRRFITPDRLRDILHETYKIAQPTRHRAL